MTEDNQLYGWGWNGFGQLGVGDTYRECRPVLVKSPNGHKWVTLFNGREHTYGMTDNGTIYAWGNNLCGRLGLGHTESQHTPQEWNVLKLLVEPTVEWTPSNHRMFGSTMKETIKVVMLSLVDKSSYSPLHGSTFFYLVPKDILYWIFQYVGEGILLCCDTTEIPTKKRRLK